MTCFRTGPENRLGRLLVAEEVWRCVFDVDVRSDTFRIARMCLLVRSECWREGRRARRFRAETEDRRRRLTFSALLEPTTNDAECWLRRPRPRPAPSVNAGLPHPTAPGGRLQLHMAATDCWDPGQTCWVPDGRPPSASIPATLLAH